MPRSVGPDNESSAELEEDWRAPQVGDEAAVTSVDQASALIRQSILSGHFAPGERLIVSSLVKQFALSPMPLRESLRKLEGEGLVEIMPNRGAFVRTLDRHFIVDLFEINTELRIFALRRSIRSITLDKLEGLRTLADAYQDAINTGKFRKGLRLNRDFHARVVSFGGNAEALRLFLRGWELIGAFRLRFGYGSGREKGFAREKHLLLDALGRQDLQLAEAILRMQHAAAMDDLLDRFAVVEADRLHTDQREN
ncbi:MULTISPECIES: GntR family transcriptional regulator [unclassified Pseudomonas]|jgi:DNA-binding GntR family transcriptional regulator|uniref:GntR family transcriptional regulator n=1 Tax=unclassified Pseudomonas TaxID=196821 RepID=UPI00131B0FAA|nr:MULTISPECIES: GntR family transcriptional regulator [unclassified Pseudomonas]